MSALKSRYTETWQRFETDRLGFAWTDQGEISSQVCWDGAEIVALTDGQVGWEEATSLVADDPNPELQRTDARKVIQAYQRWGIDFLSYLHGTLNCVLWDGQAQQAVLGNDRMGRRPFYYASVPGGWAFASEMKTLLTLPLLQRDISGHGLHEYASFNYPLGERTLARGVFRLLPGSCWIWENSTLHRRRYWSMVDFGGNPSQEQVRVEANPMVFREVIAESLNGATKAGLLLSAGYDSRAILATLRGLGAEVRTVTCGLPSSVDVRIARQLTEAVGGRHAVWPSFPGDADELAETAQELTRVAEGGVGVHYVGRYWVVKQQRGKVPVVFSGQGEMVRRTPPDSEYLSQAAFNGLRELHGGGPRAKGQAQRGEGQASGPSALCPLPSAEPFHFFDLAAIAALDGGEGKEETEETLRSYRGSTLGETVTAFLLEEGHRKVFANLGAAESTQVPVAMPFLDDRVMALVLNRPFSVTQLVDWQPSLRATMAGRRLYHRIIAENDPRLLQVPLDRGYPPAWDVGWRGWLMTGWWQVRSRTRRRMPPSSDDRLPFKTFLKNLLSEQRTRNRPFYNHGKLQQALQQFPHWPSRVEFELSKVATLELWLREFME